VPPLHLSHSLRRGDFFGRVEFLDQLLADLFLCGLQSALILGLLASPLARELADVEGLAKLGLRILIFRTERFEESFDIECFLLL
jgi:hypothetical protein